MAAAVVQLLNGLRAMSRFHDFCRFSSGSILACVEYESRSDPESAIRPDHQSKGTL